MSTVSSGVGRYTVGAQVVLTGTFTSGSGPEDPTDARVDVVEPSGARMTYTYVLAQVTRVSAGIFTYTVDTTGKSGRWSYRWYSPPPIGAANASDFIVDPFPPGTI
jgi:hypothetical protein